MKLKLMAVAALIAATTYSNAANYYVSNLVAANGSSEALYQSEGAVNAALLDGGIVALGYFGSNAYVPSSSLANIGTTISDFTVVTFALAGSASAQLAGPGAAGYVDAAVFDASNIVGSDARIGRALYVFAGNSATLEASTAWALKQVATIADDEGSENDYFANPLGGVAPVIGNYNINAFTGAPLPGVNPNPSSFNTLQLVAVPEPSAALLGMLGALGLLRRRRN